MSKVAIITDTHFGARDGRGIFHDHFERFYTNIFFAECEKHDIKTVLHLGDMFDRRKYIDYTSLKRSQDYFFNPLRDKGMEMYTVVGNHDISLRNSLDINSPDLLLKEYGNIRVIQKPVVHSIGKTDILFMPWICNENYDESMNALKTAPADICMGHFEISGFTMHRGMEAKEGFDKKNFDRFDLVFSGHYHHRHSRGSIHYLGTPYEITHVDYNDPKGFHIFDTETRELTFIKNPYTFFERYVYNEDKKLIDPKKFNKKFVKIIVQKKTDFYKFDNWLDGVYNCGAHDVKVVEDVVELTAEEMSDTVTVEDTASILEHYIQSAELSVDKNELSKFMRTLYLEAIDIDL